MPFSVGGKKTATATPAPKKPKAKYDANRELKRVLSLPVSNDLTPEECRHYTHKYLQGEAIQAGMALFPAQANAFHCYENTQRGAILPIKAGGGKTLVGLGAANTALHQFGIDRAMLVVPPMLVSQTEDNVRFWRKRAVITYPVHVVGGRAKKARERLIARRAPGLYVMPYSYLSLPETEWMLETIDPGLVVFDEVQNILSRHSARGRRIKKWIESSKPHLIAMSGTLSKKSIMEIHWLVRAALGMHSYLPEGVTDTESWAEILDAEATKHKSDYSVSPHHRLRPLLDWGSDNTADPATLDILSKADVPAYRKAYALRASSSPGYYSTSGDDTVDVPLILWNQPVELAGAEGAKRLTELIEDVQEGDITPSGDELDCAMSKHKWLYELSSGFYNELYWPEPAALAERQGWTEDYAEIMLDKAKDHYEEDQMYHKMLRQYLKNPHSGIDTPMLVGSYFSQQDTIKSDMLPLYDQWRTWHEHDFEDRPKRWSKAVRVCDYKIRAMVKWAKKAKKGIVWVHHKEMGDWAMEALEAAGLEPVQAPAGENDAIRKCGDPDLGGKGDRLFVASIGAHGTGKNLQAFQQQYFLQWPVSAFVCEQVLARLHRPGQKVDELYTVTNLSNEFDSMMFAACLNDALYYQQTHDAPQRIITCDYVVKPRIFPAIVLTERGHDANILTPAQHEELVKRFS